MIVFFGKNVTAAVTLSSISRITYHGNPPTTNMATYEFIYPKTSNNFAHRRNSNNLCKWTNQDPVFKSRELLGERGQQGENMGQYMGAMGATKDKMVIVAMGLTGTMWGQGGQ